MKKGLIVKNNFLQGETTERINRLFQASAARHGWEITVKKAGELMHSPGALRIPDCDFVIFRDKDVVLAELLEMEGLLSMSITEYLDFVRSQGAFVVHAHPFREDFYIPRIQLMPRQVDAVETVNANRKDFENERAAEYARNYGLPAIYGSDNHHASKQKRLCGIETETPIADGADFLRVLRSGAYSCFDTASEQE